MQGSSGLSKVSIAFVEYLTGKVIGEDTVKAIRGEVLQEVRKGIEQALINTERRLRNATSPELTQLLLTYPLEQEENIKVAVIRYYENPVDTTLLRLLQQSLRALAPRSIDDAQIYQVVHQYLQILREELIGFSPGSTLAEKLMALSIESLRQSNKDIQQTLKDIHSLLQLMLEIALSFSNSVQASVSKYERLGDFYMDNIYDKLLNWLNTLTDQEFRAAIRSLMTLHEQNFLRRPVAEITRVEFLGDMQERRRLPDVEAWFLKKYGERLG